MYLAKAGTREQESKTRVKKGLHRSTCWDGEIIRFNYHNPSPADQGIVVEVSAPFSFPGHDMQGSSFVVRSYYHLVLSEVNLGCTPPYILSA